MTTGLRSAKLTCEQSAYTRRGCKDLGAGGHARGIATTHSRAVVATAGYAQHNARGRRVGLVRNLVALLVPGTESGQCQFAHHLDHWNRSLRVGPPTFAIDG